MTTFVQRINNSTTTPAVTVATCNLVFPASVTSGSGIGVAMSYGGLAATQTLVSVIDDKGNNFTIVENPGLDPFTGDYQAIAYFLNATNAPQTVTITVSGATSNTIVIYGTAFEVPTPASVDVHNSGTVTTSTSFVVNITTANASEFAIMVALASMGSSGTYTQNNGWTQDSAANPFTSGFIFYNTLTSAGANSINATTSSSSHSAWSYLVFSNAGAPPPPPTVPSRGPMPKLIYTLP